MLAGIVLGYFTSWWWMLAAFVLAVGIVEIFNRRRAADQVYARVAEVVRQWEADHPELIFVLRQVEEMGESTGSFAFK